MHASFLTLLAASQAALAAPSTFTLKDRASAAAYVTTSDLSHKLSPAAAPVQGNGTGGSSTWSLSIDDTASGHKQTIIGFGGSVTDATVTVMNALSADKRTQLIKELLTQAGADFSFLRHTIAASDLSAPPAYSYDDSNSQADPNLANFNLGDRGTAMAKMLATFRTVKSGLTILGSPWSAPGWMKLNRVLTGNANNNQLDPNYYSQYAQYFVKYLQAFKANGATIDALTIQNEPLNNQGNGHVTMYQSADEATKVTQQYVGPALRAAGFNLPIWAYDHNTDVPSYPRTVVNGAGTYVNAAAWHCYASNLDWTVLTSFHNDYPSKHQYMTECWAAGTYSYTIDYYTLAQYSKFIPKGAVILSGTGSYSYSGYSGVQSVASKNPDGTRTVVIENTFGNDVYVTLSTKSGQIWSGNALANSVTTWILP